MRGPKRAGFVVMVLLIGLEVHQGILEAVELDLKNGKHVTVQQIAPASGDQIALSTTQGPVTISIFDIASIDGEPYTLFEQQDQVLEKVQEALLKNPESRGALLTPKGDADDVTRRKCFFALTLITHTVLDTEQWDLVEPFHSWWESTAQAYPREWCSRTCLGLFYARVPKNWSKAATYLEGALALDSSPQSLDVLGVDLGQVYIEQRENGKAEEISRKVLRANPGNLKAQFNLGASLINQHHFDEGLEALRTIIEISPNAPEAEGARATIQLVENTLQRGDRGAANASGEGP